MRGKSADIGLTPARIEFWRSSLCLGTPCIPEDQSYTRPDRFLPIIAVSGNAMYLEDLSYTRRNQYLPIMAVFGNAIHPRRSILHPSGPVFADHGCVWPRHMPTRIGLIQRGSIFGDHGHTIHPPSTIGVTPPGSILGDHGCV